MVATFFFQRTTTFTLFSMVASLQISCFRKPKEKQYAKLNKRMAARLIWQLVIHRCVIFAYIIRRRDGENNGFLAGGSLPPSSRAPRVSLAPKTPFLKLPFKRLPRRLKTYKQLSFGATVCFHGCQTSNVWRQNTSCLAPFLSHVHAQM